MATLGVNILLSVGTEALWGSGALSLSSPFNDRAIRLGSEDLSIERVDLFTLVAALAVAIGFYTFFKKTKFGTAMRAIAADQEAAMAQGISANKIFAMSWGIAMAIAALAGVMLSSGRSRSVDPAVSLFALVGFPAIVLGGIDSIEGALAGGMLIGIVEQIAAGYEDRIVDMVGNGFFKLTPYLLMLLILLVRPAGFFGTKEVRRV
jgi:branched-chain amino acid transport system permease protein